MSKPDLWRKTQTDWVSLSGDDQSEWQEDHHYLQILGVFKMFGNILDPIWSNMNRTLETYGSNSLKSHIASGSHPKFYFKNYFSKKVPIFRHTPLGASHKKKHPRPSQVTLWLESQRKPLREATWLLMSKASLKSLVDGWNAGLYNSISDLVWWRLVQFKEHGYSNSGHNGIHSDSDPKNGHRIE